MFVAQRHDLSYEHVDNRLPRAGDNPNSTETYSSQLRKSPLSIPLQNVKQFWIQLQKAKMVLDRFHHQRTQRP